MTESDKSVREALIKCATGFSSGETVEEYAVTAEGEYKLVKKKVTVREIPPDIKAVKLLMDGENDEAFTDEELEEEKQKLLKLLKESKI